MIIGSTYSSYRRTKVHDMHSKIIHSAPAQKNRVTPCFLPLHLSTISLKESQLIGDTSQPKQSLRKVQGTQLWGIGIGYGQKFPICRT